jgi:hypothetical protein
MLVSGCWSVKNEVILILSGIEYPVSGIQYLFVKCAGSKLLKNPFWFRLVRVGRFFYMSNPFEPKIVAFLCNWCSYAGADLAGVSRSQYPPNIRVVRVMCTGRVDPVLILEALASGIDGVFIGG